MAALATAPTLASNLTIQSTRTTTYTTCQSTPCAPCYITVDPITLSYPDYMDIQNETYTLNVTPRPITFPDGSVSTAYETEKRNFSAALPGYRSDVELKVQEVYTWVVPGNAKTNVTLTYPTTYIRYDQELSAATAKPLQVSTACAQSTDLTDITLPQSANPSSLIAASSTLDEEAVLPSAILSYLDSLPEVQQQLNDVPLTSCVRAVAPDCTTSTVVLSASCTTSTYRNLTRTLCTEVTVPGDEDDQTSTSMAEMTTSTVGNPPILVNRQPAAYLTYNTLTLSEAAGLPVTFEPDDIISPTHPGHKQSEADHGTATAASPKPTDTPAPESGTESAKSPNRVSGSAPAGEPPSDAAIAPGSSSGEQGGKSDGDGDTLETPQVGSDSGPAGIGNLWSAIQSVASYAAASQTFPPGGPSDVDQKASGTKPTATGPAAPVVTTSGLPVFTFQGQTLSPGNAATFGGSPVSVLPGRDGVFVDGTQTVLVSDGQVTTIQQSGLGPLTVSRSGSVFMIDGQTLSPGQQVTAGQTTVSLAQSTGVVYINEAATTLAGPSITIGGTVYTAAVETSTSGGDLGGYIYSGIGGSATSGSSQNSGSANGTGSTPSTGTGARLRGWDSCGWAIVFLMAWCI